MKFFENFEILWNCLKNSVFVNRRWSPSVSNKYKTFIQSSRGTKSPRKRFTLPVHSLEKYGPLNCQTTGKEKNSNFNVGNFVVMFIYWGTITSVIWWMSYYAVDHTGNFYGIWFLLLVLWNSLIFEIYFSFLGGKNQIDRSIDLKKRQYWRIWN